MMRRVQDVTADQGIWPQMIRRYFGVIAAGNLLLEFVHLPLYTLWWEGNYGQIFLAAVHCTGGDILIAGASFLGALMLMGNVQ